MYNKDILLNKRNIQSQNSKVNSKEVCGKTADEYSCVNKLKKNTISEHVWLFH